MKRIHKNYRSIILINAGLIALGAVSYTHLQGMSGSPVLQNGKLIGAITHVFVNDPTKGYGIFIENMME